MDSLYRLNSMESLHRLSILNSLHDDLLNLEFLENIERRSRVICERVDFMESMDEEDFRGRFHFSKSTVENIIEMLGDKLRSNSTRNNALTPAEKICLTLQFYATGSFQTEIGDLCCISQATANRFIIKVTNCLAELRPLFIKLPTSENERNEISQKFYQLSGFPAIYGAIDCTHIPIRSPGGPTAESFRCRKGYFSLNVQTVSDPSLLIRDIVARWPGGTHDSTIFDNSHLRTVMETQVPQSYHLIGDNGYACRSYLLTPFLSITNDRQRRYNSAHIRARNVVKRQYEVWKRRFPCLSTPFRCDLQNTMSTIVAAGVLHNIAITMNDCVTDEESDSETDDVSLTNSSITTGGLAKRNRIVNSFF